MASAATRVFMVRHGATVVSAEDRFAGASDVALSDEGREQIRQLAERLSNEKIARLASRSDASLDRQILRRAQMRCRRAMGCVRFRTAAGNR